MTTRPHRPVRLIDIAERANTSRSAVGKVLLGSGSSIRVGQATAERIHRIAREMGYRPSLIARQLSGERTRTLGVLIGANRYPLYYERLRAIDREANSRGYRLLVSYIHGEEDAEDEIIDQLDDMEGRGVEGVIMLHAYRKLSPRLRRRLKQVRLVVCQTPLYRLSNMCSITVDLAAGAQMLYDHLVERGRRRIGTLAHAREDDRVSQRLRGFRAAAKRHAGTVEAFEWSGGRGEDRMTPTMLRPIVEAGLDELLAHRVDAIMASNDQWAVQTIKVLLARGYRVPHDVAVTGVDNIESAIAVIPELTTIDQRNMEFAQHVMDICERMNEEKWPPANLRRTVIMPRLVAREST